MAVYYGVIEGNSVVWDGDVRLADGTRVEVRPHPVETWDVARVEEGVKDRLRAAGVLAPVPPDSDDVEDDDVEDDDVEDDMGPAEAAMTEAAFRDRSRAEGRLASGSSPWSASPARDRRLIEVRGQPLSEQIIVERR